jgi:hypothetical protein
MASKNSEIKLFRYLLTQNTIEAQKEKSMAMEENSCHKLKTPCTGENLHKGPMAIQPSTSTDVDYHIYRVK